MKNSTLGMVVTGFVPVMLLLATSACATKGFVKAQVADSNARISAVEAKSNEQIAALSNKEQTDISRVDEKIATTDNKVAEVSNTAQQANTTANQANQLAQQNQTATAANSTAISNLDKSMNYSLVAKGDVTFGFNKYTLGPTDQAALDALAQQVQSRPRAVFELYGFTDPVGSKQYNLGLSQRRADAVARYLVHQGIPLRGIRIIGMGKEPVPQNLLADLQAVDPNATAGNSSRLARRVLIRIYAADASLPSSASLR